MCDSLRAGALRVWTSVIPSAGLRNSVGLIMRILRGRCLTKYNEHGQSQTGVPSTTSYNNTVKYSPHWICFEHILAP